jgi:hypothetical protein
MFAVPIYKHIEKVLDLHDKILKFEVTPDEITYLGILSCCWTAGLENEAKYHLN